MKRQYKEILTLSEIFFVDGHGVVGEVVYDRSKKGYRLEVVAGGERAEADV